MYCCRMTKSRAVSGFIGVPRAMMAPRGESTQSAGAMRYASRGHHWPRAASAIATLAVMPAVDAGEQTITCTY